MSYVFKPEDAFGLARLIGAETHEHGDELFFKFCPKCKGGDHHDKDTFSINLKTGLFKCFRAGCAIIAGTLWSWQGILTMTLDSEKSGFTGNCLRSQ